MVTRSQISEKLDTLKGTQMEKYTQIAEWLEEEGELPEDRNKILDDLVTYENY